MRAWTVLVYMAGDAGAYFEGPIGDERLFADVSKPLQADLRKLAQAGSTERVAVCVQFDSLANHQAFRWIVPLKDKTAIAEMPGEGTSAPRPIGSLNTGEPGSLSDFIGWSGQNCPAEHYALVIWGHGAGWSEERIYDRYPAATAATRDASPGKRDMLRRGVFASTVGKILGIRDARTRALCYDDSARDFLDNQELRRALRDGANALGRERLDVLGLDACLMVMLEVAQEMRGEAAYLVGSETVLPTDFWPWEQLLGELQTRPELGPRDVALLMGGHLPENAAGTRAWADVCQSVLDLDRAQAATIALDEWSRAALELYERDPLLRRAFKDALKSQGQGALRLAIPAAGATDYVDLLDLLRVVLDAWDLSEIDRFRAAGPDAGTPAKALLRRQTWQLLECIVPAGPESIVMRTRVEGFSRRPQPGGLSIYLPQSGRVTQDECPLSPEYGNLMFADTAWPELVCRLYQSELPAPFVNVRESRRTSISQGAA